jgi:HAD superfamily hydrolase (TIGR01509 family)
VSDYTHILFDHDGVLVDTEHLYYRSTRETLAAMGFELPMDTYLSIQAVGGNAWMCMLDAGYTQAQVAEKRQERNALYQHYLSTEDIDIVNVEQVLQRLKRRLTLAIVTTARQEDFDLIHAQRSITEHMQLILTNKDYARSKPHPDPYLAALDHFDIEPSRALVVEDSERGLKAAVAAGIDCAVVAHPFTAPQDFSAATYRLQNLTELIALLDA